MIAGFVLSVAVGLYGLVLILPLGVQVSWPPFGGSQTAVQGLYRPASPAPTAAGALGPIPNEPVFYALDAADRTRLVAIDWHGRAVGALRIPSTLDRGKRLASPDGRYIYVGGAFVDHSGRQAWELKADLGEPTWADDGVHLCGVSLAGELWTAAFGGRIDTLVTLPAVQAQRVAACSYARGLMVVVRTVDSSTTEVYLVSLTGAGVIAHHAYSAASVVVSPDARYLLVNEPADGPAVLRALTGDAMGDLGSPSGEAFIGGSQVLVLYREGRLDGLSLPSRQVIWSGPSAFALDVVASDGAGRLVLARPDPACPAGSACAGESFLEILHSDGSTRAVLGEYYPLQ